VATEVRSDLVNHPYFLIINIWELYLQIKAKIRRTRLINSYDNRIGPGIVYQGDIDFNRRAIDDIDWEPLI
jgi:hypothetical protein